jgi:hypothetical protein
MVARGKDRVGSLFVPGATSSPRNPGVPHPQGSLSHQSAVGRSPPAASGAPHVRRAHVATMAARDAASVIR